MTARLPVILLALILALISVGCDSLKSPTEPTPTLAVSVIDTVISTSSSCVLQLDIGAAGGQEPYTYRTTSPAIQGTASGTRVNIRLPVATVDDIEVNIEVSDSDGAEYRGSFIFPVDCGANASRL